jgi:peptidoglycan/xylan/chitin deacetylase (PgdA/CDA1 family)
MAFWKVERPRETRTGSVRMAVGAVASLALIAFLQTPLLAVPVTVDGARHEVAVGTRLQDLVDSGLVASARGDVVAAGDGTVVAAGAGRPVGVFVDGDPADPELRIMRPMDVVTADGADVVESLTTGREPIPIPVVEEGEGSFVRLASPGAVGVIELTRGELSGQIVAERVVEEPAPMVLRRVQLSPRDAVVALTFDDGPWPGQTERILDILAAERVRATFFMLGSQVDRHPDLARRVVEEGHMVGNHSYTHVRTRVAHPMTASAEIAAGRDAIERATGVRPGWYRPPGGIDTPSVYAASEQAGNYVLLWTVDPQDWKRPTPDRLTADVLAASERGSVILLHDGGGDRTATIEALPGIIRGLKARGFEFVTTQEIPALAWQ